MTSGNITARTPLSVLVIEDNPEFRESLVNYLKSQKFVVFEASDRYEALMLWQTESIDAVIIEYTVSGMSGLDLLEELGNTREGGNFCAIITAPSPIHSLSKKKLSRFSNVSVITKPFQLRILRNRLLENMGLPPQITIPPEPPDGEKDGGVLLFQRQALPEEGYLIDEFLGALLHSVFVEQFSGIMHLETDEGDKRIYFSNGLPVYAESEIVSETLGAFLVRNSIITREQNEDLLGAMKSTGMRHGEIMVQSGLMTPHDLYVHLEAHIMDKINSAFDLLNAYFKLVPGDEWMGSIMPARIPIGRLILDGVKRSIPADQVRAELGLNDTDLPFMLPDQIYTADQLRLAPEELRLKRGIDHKLPFRDLISTNPAQRRDDARIIYALFLMQIMGIELNGAEKITAPKSVKAPPGRRSDARQTRSAESGAMSERAQMMLSEYLKLRDVDYYKLLGVNRDATREEIRKSYAEKSQRYHPDNIIGLGSPLVQGKLKELYLRIEEAAKILTNDKSRQKYDQKISKKMAYPSGIATGIRKRKKTRKRPSGRKKGKGADSASRAEDISRLPDWQLFSRGKGLMQSENYTEAETVFRKAHEKKSDPKYIAYVAWTRFLQDPEKNRAEAIQILDDIQQESSGDAVCQYIRGMISMHDKKHDVALMCFEKAIDIDPNYIEAARQHRHCKNLQKSDDKKKEGSALSMDIGDLFRKWRKK